MVEGVDVHNSEEIMKDGITGSLTAIKELVGKMTDLSELAEISTALKKLEEGASASVVRDGTIAADTSELEKP